ncbi:hypothetical protein T492DRAFT_843696 [Pavlovales sp. CCMP2436]|nr:hypothetical protein T492DRAFT_843696 [Pavlovales sp. CCMP2436]
MAGDTISKERPSLSKGGKKPSKADALSKAEAEAAAIVEALARSKAWEEKEEEEAAAAATATAAASRRRVSADERPVEEAELLEFLFPTKPIRLYHSPSAARLFLFARHGPLVEGAIVGGRFDRRHPLTQSELALMLEQVTREDLLAAFVGDKELPPAEQEAVLSEARALRSKMYDYTQKEIQV